MKIGIDIDGVLVNYYEACMDNATKYFYEHKIKYNIDSSKYYETDIFNVPYENMEKVWNEYLEDYARRYPPRKYAAEVISKLKENNEICIITARNEEGLPEEAQGTMGLMVKEWLDNNKIEYDKLIFSNGSKLEICKQENIDIMIEDKPTNVLEISNYIPVLCFDNPYNRQVAGNNIIRVYSWYNILQNIEDCRRMRR